MRNRIETIREDKEGVTCGSCHPRRNPKRIEARTKLNKLSLKNLFMRSSIYPTVFDSSLIMLHSPDIHPEVSCDEFCCHI
jgi:hypothetical protein